MKAKQWATAAVAALLMWTGAFGCAQAESMEGSRGVLYKVSGTKGSLYLLGSIHVGSEGMYPFGESHHPCDGGFGCIYV